MLIKNYATQYLLSATRWNRKKHRVKRRKSGKPELSPFPSIIAKVNLSLFLRHIYYIVLNPFSNQPWLLRDCSTSLLKTPRIKAGIAPNKQFLLFRQCFLSNLKTFYHFQIWSSRLQILSVWKCLKFVAWERFKCFGLVRQTKIRFKTEASVQNIVQNEVIKRMWKTIRNKTL